MDVIAVRAVLGLCRWQGTADDNGRSNPQRTAAACSNRAACVDNENFGHAELQKLRNNMPDHAAADQPLEASAEVG